MRGDAPAIRSGWRRTIPAFAAILLCCAGAQAEEPTDSELDGSEIPDVVVTASRVERPAHEEPVAVYVIDADEINAAGMQTVGDALRWVPGLDISGGAPFAAAKRSTVLFQGLPAQYSLI